MKYRNLLLVLFFVGIVFSSCKRQDDPIPTPPIEEPEPQKCVDTEVSSSDETGFLIFDKGTQEEGYAKGVKINEDWEASAYMLNTDGASTIYSYTRWDSIFHNGEWHYYDFVLAEKIILGYLFDSISFGCHPLIKYVIGETPDSIWASYDVYNDDIVVVSYELDEQADNRLEIIEFDESAGIFTGKFKATFVTDNPGPPEFPERVRFSNVEIKIGQ